MKVTLTKIKKKIKKHRSDLIPAGIIIGAATLTSYIVLRLVEKKRHEKHWSCLEIDFDGYRAMNEGDSLIYNLGGENYTIQKDIADS